MRGTIEESHGDHQAVLRLSQDELALLAGSINEALEAIEDWEFSIRLGASKAEAESLGDALRGLLDEFPVDRT